MRRERQALPKAEGVRAVAVTGKAPAGERIRRLQRRYQGGDAYISVERARYYTESWRATGGSGIALPVRVALAMKHVYENMNHYIDPDDHIAGYWTEYFLGMPIDIERGVFNRVLEAELSKSSMLYHRLRSMTRGFLYMLKKRQLREFLKNMRITSRHGPRSLNLRLKTMQEREINPFQISKADRRLLLRKLLPYWSGRTIVDALEKELEGAGLLSAQMRELTDNTAGNTSRQVLMLSPSATIGTYQGHVILDYRKVLDRGLVAMKAEVEERLAAAAEGEERDFLESMSIALDGVMVFAVRLVGKLEKELGSETGEERRLELSRMLEVCRKVPLEPAKSFREAVQSIWTVKVAVELAHPVNLHCFGRLDQDLYPYYKRDIEGGRTTPDAARELLEELLLKVMSLNMRPESNILGNFYHRYLGSTPVTLGGLLPDGSDGTNELTGLFLQAAHNSKAITNISVRVHEGTDDSLLTELAKYLHDCTSSYALFNDASIIEAMRRRGFSEEDARDYAIMGCVEACCPGKTGSMSANALLLIRLLDTTLRNGDCRMIAGTVRGEGLRTGDLDCFDSFDEFLQALIEQGKHSIEMIVEGSNMRDRLFAERLPAPYISAFMDGCLESGRDVTRGGARYGLSGISMINSIANLVDSLYVIKKLVFEEKKFTFRELLTAVDGDFEDGGEIYRATKKLGGKWGNGNPETDGLAAKVTKSLFDETYKYRSYNGGPFVVYVISMTTHTIDGRLSLASPDGRRAATPFAASCNPYNVERSGITAALRSVASLPFEDVMGCAVNVRFHPTGIGDRPETREKWASLVRTYFELGGAQIQPT
ncbi:MAG: hypothetical protein MUO75_01705, partial [Actinobacteria bacterium]|nr:hypothetical protein [Actinomycetota bacterium]